MHVPAPHPLVALPGAHGLVGSVPVLAPQGINTSVYLDVNGFSRHTPWAHAFMHDYALWLGPALLTAAFVVILGIAWWRRAPRAVALLLLGGLGTIAALILNQVIGHAVGELRPYVTHPGALVLVGKTNDASFPSDHSVIAGGLTAAILLVTGSPLWRSMTRASDGPEPERDIRAPLPVRIIAIVSVALGLFLGFARIYVGAHYPVDVVAGYLLGGVVVLLVSLLRSLVFRGVEAIEPTPLRALVQRPVPA